MLRSDSSASAGDTFPAAHAFDRKAPLGEAERTLLQSYLEDVEGLVAPHIEATRLAQLRRLVDPRSPQHLLAQPYLTMTWVSELGPARTRL